MGRSPCCEKEGLKKGPWTPEEDERLISYVKEHGHGNWRALPKKCGLLRCGKSCRLRWTNYLRPDIKRGVFSHSEEQKIILLHALVGNKWAFIASQLPKRTDNEIKNYWNTVIRKRLQKQGLLTSMPTSKLSPNAVEAAQDKNSIKGSASSWLLCSNSATRPNSMQGKSSSHLSQWESARLEAEARLAKESQSTKLHRLLSFNSGPLISRTPPRPPPPPPPPSTLPPPSTTTTTASAFTSFSKTKPATQHTYPCSISHLLSTNSSPSISINHSAYSATNQSFTLSSTSRKSFSSQGNTAPALTLRRNGKLSWKTQDLAFTSSPIPQRVSYNSKLDMDHQQAHKAASYIGPTGKALEVQQQNAGGGDNTMLDLNSMISLPSADNWQDLLFDVENSCSDVVSTWRSQEMEPISTSQIDLETDATSLISINTNSKSTPLECSQTHVPHVLGGSHPHHHHHGLHTACNMDLDGLNLCHLDSFLCEHTSANQQSNVLLWDRLSINS